MKKLLLSLLNQRRIAGGALVLAVTQLIASGCGFLRDQAFSIMFPLDKDPLGVASIYIAAFRPSDLLFQVMVMSCLSVVVVPFLSAHLAHGRHEEMNKILTSTMIVFGGVFGLAALVLAIFFPQIAPYFVQFEGDALELYIHFGRIALLTNFLFVFGNALGQYLISIQRYWIYGITPIIWSLCTILGTYFLTPVIGMIGPIVGTLVGTLIYVFIRAIAVYKSGYRVAADREALLHPELREMGLLIIPRMAALGALHLQFLLLDRLASGLGPQMVAVNQFASNFESVIPGIVGIAIAQSSFSLFSQSAAGKDFNKLFAHFRKSILFNLSLAIPGALVLALSTGIAAWLMHLSGLSAALFTTSLLIYALAVPFESTNHIILRSFYALKNTLFPAISSGISCCVAVIAGTLLVPTYGILALPCAYVIAQVSQTLLLSLSLRTVFSAFGDRQS